MEGDGQALENRSIAGVANFTGDLKGTADFLATAARQATLYLKEKATYGRNAFLRAIEQMNERLHQFPKVETFPTKPEHVHDVSTFNGVSLFGILSISSKLYAGRAANDMFDTLGFDQFFGRTLETA